MSTVAGEVQKARAQGWDESQLRTEIQRFLTSSEYQALEQEKAPHSRKIEEIKTALRAVKTLAEAQLMCRRFTEVLEPVEASFGINERQIQLAETAFSSSTR